MEFKSVYSEDALRDLYDKIMHQRKLGTIKYFEIFIDNMSVIPRTNDVGNFFKYKSQLRQNSRTVLIKLYKGDSRVNDSYLFETSYLLALKKQQADEELITKALDKEEQILELKYKINRLTKKKNKLKKRNQVLETQNKELTNKKQAFELVGKLTQSFVSDNSNSETKVEDALKSESQDSENSKVAGIEIDDLLKIYHDLKDSLSDSEFQAILGIVLSLSDCKELIKPTHEFISSKVKELPQNNQSQ